MPAEPVDFGPAGNLFIIKQITHWRLPFAFFWHYYMANFKFCFDDELQCE